METLEEPTVLRSLEPEGGDFEEVTAASPTSVFGAVDRPGGVMTGGTAASRSIVAGGGGQRGGGGGSGSAIPTPARTQLNRTSIVLTRSSNGLGRNGRKSTNITVSSPSPKLAVEATFKDAPSGRYSPSAAASAAESGEHVGPATRLRFTTNTSVQPVQGEAVAGICDVTPGPPPYTPPPPPAVTSREESGVAAAPDTTTNVEIVTQPLERGRRRDSSTSSVGTNTEIEVFCTAESSGGAIAKEVSLAGMPAALFGDQAFEKGAEEEELLKNELPGGQKAQSRVRAAIDAAGLSAVVFYIVMWLSLFLFNAVCLCLLWLLVPCVFGRQTAGCLLLPACPAWGGPAVASFAAAPPVVQHPI